MTNDARTEVFTPPTACALDPSISLPDYATTTHIEPQPAWRTLNAARERAFTGEIKFLTTPEIVTYIDGGSVYFAERVGERPLGERLVEAGVVTPQQLDRGVVRVGGTEHLGRLFDPDETIDRDAVMVVVEAATEALVSELAAEVVTAIEVGAYRHHPSGVHRWFVAPADSSLARPVSDVAQVDRSVIDDLPDVTTARTEVTIEWDHPAPTDGQALAAPVADGFDEPNTNTIQLDLEAELDRFNADKADWSTPRDATPDDDADEASWLTDFQIVWPDGTEERATPSPSHRPASDPVETVSLDIPPAAPEPAAASSTTEQAHEPIAAPPSPLEVPPVVNGVAAPAPSPATDESDGVRFAMPQIVIDSAPEPDADIPVDVADAVRRALRAIENAAVEPASLRQIDLEPLTLPDLTLDSLDEQKAPASVDMATSTLPTPTPTGDALAAAETLPSPSSALPTTPSLDAPPAPIVETAASVAFEAPAPQPVSSFAPPSSATRAEAIYAQAAAVATSTAVEPDQRPIQQQPAPEPGQASVVFRDEDDDDGKSRKGALRRLIGSLRKAS